MKFFEIMTGVVSAIHVYHSEKFFCKNFLTNLFFVFILRVVVKMVNSVLQTWRQ